MKLKTLLLLICLMLLLTAMSYAQQQTESGNGQSNDYGIELEQNYPGALVLELLREVGAEIEIAVDEAYAEGYKAGTLRYAPDIEFLKFQISDLQKKNLRSKLGFGAAGLLIGLVGGFSIQFVLQ